MNLEAEQPILNITYADIAAFCRRYSIRRMWLFGSVIRDDFTPESDVDVLVEFEAGQLPGWAFFGEMPQALEQLFGHKVDLLTPDSLSQYMRDDVMQGARLVYG